MSFLQGLFGPPNVERLKAKRDVKGLIKAVGYEKDAEVRRAAAVALGELADAQVMEPLLAALRDGDKNVRQAAAEALGEMGTPAIERLMAALEDSDTDRQTASAAALSEICGRRKDDGLRTQIAERFVHALMKVEESISGVEHEKKSMEEKNPLVGRIGIMLCDGSPPAGLKNAIEDSESRYESLTRKLSKYRKVETEWRAMLSALTGKNFERSSEWAEWFRKEHQ